MKIFDNVVSYKKNLEIFYSVLTKPYFYGETDRGDTPVTGLVHDLKINNNDDVLLLDELKKVIFSFCPDLQEKELYRSYVNLFFPNENPFFHDDGLGTTCLFYFNPKFELDEGGETQFYIDDQIIGVLPYPARLVIFDGKILHRATSFRKHPRITIALKFHNVIINY